MLFSTLRCKVHCAVKHIALPRIKVLGANSLDAIDSSHKVHGMEITMVNRSWIWYNSRKGVEVLTGTDQIMLNQNRLDVIETSHKVLGIED